MKKILYITGTRADYGLMKSTLLAIREHPRLSLEVLITGMHLMPKFGLTAAQIQHDWQRYKSVKVHQVPVTYDHDNPPSMLKFIGDLTTQLARRLPQIKPDIILLLGDRPEMLAAAIAGNYLSRPVAHVHGGDVSSTADNATRHAITKLAHIHFPVTAAAAGRISKMGEPAWRIFRVNAPGLDDILQTPLKTKKQIFADYHLNPANPLLIVLQHPVTLEQQDAGKQMLATMSVIKDLAHPTIVIYPNADAGSRQMIKIIEKYRRYPFIQIFQNLPRRDFLSLMKAADVMIGNSSSGIIESGAFGLPVVNVGSRQAGRERGPNVIDVVSNEPAIKRAIRKAMAINKEQRITKTTPYVYRQDFSGAKIAATLHQIKTDRKLLDKKLTY